jgi:DNA-binding protein H-NS
VRIPVRRAKAPARSITLGGKVVSASETRLLTREQYHKLKEQLRDLRDEERRLMMKEREAR